MLEHKELAAPGSVMGTGIESLDPDVPLDLSKYATAELKLVVDLDHYAVRDEAYRRSERLVKRPGDRRKTCLGSSPGVEGMWPGHRCRKQAGNGRAECDPYCVTGCSSLACAKTNALTTFSASNRSSLHYS